jgi:hypothetical protein
VAFEVVLGHIRWAGIRARNTNTKHARYCIYKCPDPVSVSGCRSPVVPRAPVRRLLWPRCPGLVVRQVSGPKT